jgi:hypothetical protein
MDTIRFDRLVRILTDTRSRRGALAALFGGSLGLLGLADAASRKGKGKKAKGRKGKKQRPVAPTCTDGVQNGRERDVDCGGPCARCANARTCTNQDDCASALCVSGVCKACGLFVSDCGIDAAGPCQCHTRNIAEQPSVCTSASPAPTFDSCDHCADDTFCVRTGNGDYTCYQPCGAV